MSRPVLPRLLLAATFAVGLIAACDSGGGGAADPNEGTVDPNSPTTPDPNTPTSPADPNNPTTPADPNNPTDPTAPVYPEKCDITGFNAAVEQFSQPQSGFNVYRAATTTEGPSDLLSFEFYTSGNYAGASGPGTIDLTGSNYETCADCVLVRRNCTDAGCEKVFYADEGQLVIESWSDDDGFSGRLDGVVLREVTIDDQTYRSTPVDGGQVWCLDGYTFSTTAGPPKGGDNTQETCVAAGTGDLLEDNIANFTLTNCNGEPVALHDTCGQNKALMLIGTAGWCHACEDLLANLVSNHGGSLSRAIVAQETPGMDMLVVLGENQYRELPSEAYCKAYAEGQGIDPAMVVIDHDVAGRNIPLIEPAGYAVEVNSFATVWSNMNPYMRAEGDAVSTSTPWIMLLDATNMRYACTGTASSETLEASLGALLSQ